MLPMKFSNKRGSSSGKPERFVRNVGPADVKALWQLLVRYFHL
jgi:hypothetical protein